MPISWPQALAWRLRRHLLDPVGTLSVHDVVQRLGAVPATPETGAELAVAVRRTGSRAGEVAEALARGRLLRTYAFRGAAHLLTPEDGGVPLALRASSRMWERKSWESYYDLRASDWPDFRACVRESLADGPQTREQLAAVLEQQPRFAHLAPFVTEGSDTLLKPLAWQGDLCFGPSRDGRATLQSLQQVPGWAGLPDTEEAGPRAVESYLATYGPTTPAHVQYWLGEGLGAGRRPIQGWLAGLGDRLAEVTVDGRPSVMLREDLDELESTRPTTSVRLLPGYDQWVLGPGTKEDCIVPPAHRPAVTRRANLVISGGVLVGTWALREGRLTVSCFDEVDPPDPALLDAEVARVSEILRLGAN
jgi:hypothetical protein